MDQRMMFLRVGGDDVIPSLGNRTTTCLHRNHTRRNGPNLRRSGDSKKINLEYKDGQVGRTR